MHNYATKSLLVLKGHPTFNLKLPISLDWSPLPSNTPIDRPTQLTTANGIQIQSALFPQLTYWTARQTDRQMAEVTNLYKYPLMLYCTDRATRLNINKLLLATAHTTNELGSRHSVTFGALTLLVMQQEGHPAQKNLHHLSQKLSCRTSKKAKKKKKMTKLRVWSIGCVFFSLTRPLSPWVDKPLISLMHSQYNARYMVTFEVKQHHRPLTSTKLFAEQVEKKING